MIATIFLFVFLLFVPKAFKNTGIKLIVRNQKRGYLLLITSKILWWFAFIQITLIWLESYMTYVWLFAGTALLYKLFHDRKFLFFKVLRNRKKAKAT